MSMARTSVRPASRWLNRCGRAELESVVGSSASVNLASIGDSAAPAKRFAQPGRYNARGSRKSQSHAMAPNRARN